MMQVTTLVAFFFIFQFGVLVKGQSDPNPTAEVTCGSNGQPISITISGLTDLDQWSGSEAEWDLDDGSNPNCDATLNSTAGTVSYGPVNASECDDVSTTNEYFEYQFDITPNEGPADTPVRRYDHSYTIKCRYYRNGTVEANFTPIHQLSAQDEGSGDLDLALNLYSDSAYTTSLSGTVNLESKIYARVTITNSFEQSLDIFLGRCWASSDAAGIVGQHDFIEDSCEDQDDNTVTYDCDGQTDEEEDFDFKAFRYPTQTDGTPNYVHCDIYVCLSSNMNSVCQTQCNDTECPSSPMRRKRRDADQFSGKVYRVDARPYTVVDVEEGQKDAGAGEQEGKSASTANLAIILSVSGVVAIAIVCVVVVVVLRKRRQNVTLAGGEAHDNNMKI